MAKYFIDVVQDSLKAGLGIPIKTEYPLSRSAPTARTTASLATPHLAQTKSVCSALSTRDPQ